MWLPHCRVSTRSQGNNPSGYYQVPHCAVSAKWPRSQPISWLLSSPVSTRWRDNNPSGDCLTVQCLPGDQGHNPPGDYLTVQCPPGDQGHSPPCDYRYLTFQCHFPVSTGTMWPRSQPTRWLPHCPVFSRWSRSQPTRWLPDCPVSTWWPRSNLPCDYLTVQCLPGDQSHKPPGDYLTNLLSIVYQVTTLLSNYPVSTRWQGNNPSGDYQVPHCAVSTKWPKSQPSRWLSYYQVSTRWQGNNPSGDYLTVHCTVCSVYQVTKVTTYQLTT